MTHSTLYHYNLIHFNWFTNSSPELTWRDVQHLVVWSSTIDSVLHNPGDNFINILRTTFFLFEGALHNFSLITIWLCNFWCKNIGKKAVHKMMMKLTTGFNFINIYECLSVQKCFAQLFSNYNLVL